nr:protein ALP1-like [Hydra vulgaris]
MEDSKETVSILNTEALDYTSDVQSIVTIPDEEPTQSTSGSNKNLDVQIRSQELQIREVVALERICDAIENAPKAQVDVSKAQECEFKEHFRVNRNTFNFLVNELHPHLGKTTTTMREPISVVKRVAVALHYLASCEEYRVVSSLFGIGKSTANLIVHEFINAVNDILLPKYVKFPFFPQCVGAVNGCHIPISAPKDQAISYYNYKGWYSIVLFAVVDSRYRFIYTSVGLPGRNNDSYILQNSSLKEILESNLFDKCCKELGDSLVPLCLIGDSAFPLTRHLLKPYPENLELSEIQKNFNKILCGARRVVENAFGRVKARFRVICKRMECDINFATRIVNACVTLHNICEYYDDIIIIEWLMHHHDDSLAQPNSVSTTGNNGPGKNVRDSIAKYLYKRDK